MQGVTKSNVFRCDYNVYSTFQSHEPEFDYLKSLEIEEKINQICWVKQSGSSLFLLTTNGNTIHYAIVINSAIICIILVVVFVVLFTPSMYSS
jgi:hypothetical protein